MATEEKIREVKRRHSMNLLKQPGVSGVGVERDEAGDYVLTIHIDDAAARANLPDEIEGHPVKYVHSGPFRALSDKD